MYIRFTALFACASVSVLFGQVTQYPNNYNLVPTYNTFATTLKSDLNATTSTGVVRLAVLGDSLSYCTLASCGGTFSNTLWTNLMKTYLQTNWGNHGTGIIPFRAQSDTSSVNSNAIASYANFTPGGGCNINTFTQAAISGTVTDQLAQACFTANGATATITGTAYTYDHLNFLYQTISGPLGANVTIDSTGVGTIGAQGTSSVQSTTFAAPGGLGSHTWALSMINSGNPALFLYGVEGIVGSTGVSVDNVATGGARAEYFSALNATGATTAAMPMQTWSANAAHTYFIIMVGTNDWIHDTADHHAGYLGTIISNLIANGFATSHILVISPPFSDPTHTNNQVANDQTAYKDADKRVSASYNVSYLDICTIDSTFCNFAIQNTSGYELGDQIHMSAAGQTAWWNDIKIALGI